jgi:type I restriction enzyme R subunit
MDWELDEVERPFVEQLTALGWSYLAGDLDRPAKTGRTSFAEVTHEATLRRQLRAINLREVAGVAQPWLDQERLTQAVGAITRIPAHRLMEANRIATELLQGGITVDGLPGWDGGRAQTIYYIDWDHPERNEFTVVNQYRVDCPPGFNRGKAFIVPGPGVAGERHSAGGDRVQKPVGARAHGRGRGPVAPLQQRAPRQRRSR